jgi:hypothetical protein
MGIAYQIVQFDQQLEIIQVFWQLKIVLTLELVYLYKYFLVIRVCLCVYTYL